MKSWQLAQAEYDFLNPPPEESRVIDDKRWVLPINSADWLPVGYIPMPRSKSEWFVYHFIHGVCMRYPLVKVILFCLDNSNYPGVQE